VAEALPFWLCYLAVCPSVVRPLHSDNFDEHSKRIYWSLTAAAPGNSVFRALCTNLLTYLPISRDVFLTAGGISTNLGTNIHASGHCWNGFQGQRSDTKVVYKWVNVIMAEAYISATCIETALFYPVVCNYIVVTLNAILELNFVQCPCNSFCDSVT